MPKVHLVDMRDENAECKQNVVVSRSMERMLSLTLQRGEQSLILMNRRGFANRLYCPSCRISLTCSNCNVGLVVHTSTGDSICHYCRHPHAYADEVSQRNVLASVWCSSGWARSRSRMSCATGSPTPASPAWTAIR